MDVVYCHQPNEQRTAPIITTIISRLIRGLLAKETKTRELIAKDQQQASYLFIFFERGTGTHQSIYNFEYFTMHFSTAAIALWCLSVSGVSAFSPQASTNVAFVSKVSSVANSRVHSAGCACPSCVTFHTSGCSCAGCASTHRTTALFADVADDVEVPAHVADDVDVPAEVEAMDGVESADEAHNVERPARANLKKKKKEGKEITELEVGSMVSGSVKSITTYGAFIDIGAQTDGLLHISQLASGFVANVGDILKEGQEVEVRIVSVDTGKGQVALSLLTEEEAAAGHQPRRERPKRQSNRRDDSAALSALAEKGFDPETFVEGKVVSTVDFGCFVRVDVSKLNGECEGEVDGLVHISALGSGRVNSVTDVVNVDDSVQVRLKSINGNKVSLTMLSLEDEAKKMEAQNERRGGGEIEGAKDWKEQLEKLEDTMPTFKNPPLVEDRRK